jgi:hypothetical protein
MTAFQVLIDFIIALVVGSVVWFVASLIPPFKPKAPAFGIAACIILLLIFFLPVLFSYAG